MNKGALVRNPIFDMADKQIRQLSGSLRLFHGSQVLQGNQHIQVAVWIGLCFQLMETHLQLSFFF